MSIDLNKIWLPEQVKRFLHNVNSWFPKYFYRDRNRVNPPLVLEIGGGGSTLLHLSLGNSVILIENDLAYRNNIIDTVSSLGYEVCQIDDHVFLESQQAEPVLYIMSATSYTEIHYILETQEFLYVLVDGDFRYEIVNFYYSRGLQNIGFLIVDNFEYCCSYGILPVGAAFPERVICYRNILRSAENRHMILTDNNFKEKSTNIDGEIHFSAIIYDRNSFLVKSLTTCAGIPLLSWEGISDSTITELRERCPYPTSNQYFDTGVSL